MAQRVQVILVCDLHEGEVAGTETVAFAVDGSSYEIDVCDEHAKALRDSFAPYIGAGRRGAGRTSRSSTGRRRSRRGGSGEAAQIREWARGQGLAVPERGRVPAELAEKYAAAHR